MKTKTPQGSIGRLPLLQKAAGVVNRPFALEERASIETTWEDLLPALFQEYVTSLKGLEGVGLSSLTQWVAKAVGDQARLSVDEVKGVFTFDPVLSFPDLEKAVLPFLVDRLQKVYPNLRKFSAKDMVQQILSRYREDRVLRFLSEQVASMVRARFSELSDFPTLMRLSDEVKGVEWDAPFRDTLVRAFKDLLPSALEAHQKSLGHLTPAMVRDYLVEFREFSAPPEFLRFLKDSGLDHQVWTHPEVAKLRNTPGGLARALRERYQSAYAALKAILTQKVTLDALAKSFVARYPKVIQVAFYSSAGASTGGGPSQGKEAVRDGFIRRVVDFLHLREGEDEDPPGEGDVPIPPAPLPSEGYRSWVQDEASFARVMLFKVDKETGEVVDYEEVIESSPRAVFALIDARHRDKSSPFWYEAIPCFNREVWTFLERYAMARVLARERTVPPALRERRGPIDLPSEG